MTDSEQRYSGLWLTLALVALALLAVITVAVTLPYGYAIARSIGRARAAEAMRKTDAADALRHVNLSERVTMRLIAMTPAKLSPVSADLPYETTITVRVTNANNDALSVAIGRMRLVTSAGDPVGEVDFSVTQPIEGRTFRDVTATVLTREAPPAGVRCRFDGSLVFADGTRTTTSAH